MVVNRGDSSTKTWSHTVKASECRCLGQISKSVCCTCVCTHIHLKRVKYLLSFGLYSNALKPFQFAIGVDPFRPVCLRSNENILEMSFSTYLFRVGELDKYIHTLCTYWNKEKPRGLIIRAWLSRELISFQGKKVGWKGKAFYAKPGCIHPRGS